MLLNINGNTLISPHGVGVSIDSPGFNMSLQITMNTDPFSAFPFGGVQYSSMTSLGGGFGVYPKIGKYGRRGRSRDVFAWMNDPNLLRIGTPSLFRDVWRKNDIQWARMQGKREERLAQKARDKQYAENNPKEAKHTLKEWQEIMAKRQA